MTLYSRLTPGALADDLAMAVIGKAIDARLDPANREKYDAEIDRLIGLTAPTEGQGENK
jgi:hypothetical protein